MRQRDYLALKKYFFKHCFYFVPGMSTVFIQQICFSVENKKTYIKTKLKDGEKDGEKEGKKGERKVKEKR